MLSGSKREVYETGSQVADLHLMLSATQPPVQDGTWGEQFKRAVLTASSESFPDLAREMGVEVVRPKEISTKLATPETDDKVREMEIWARGRVNANFCVNYAENSGCTQNHGNGACSVREKRDSVSTRLK